MVMLKRYLLIIVCFFIYSDFTFAFIEPDYIPVTKPTPTATKTVCSSGCDYTTIEEADQAAQPGWVIQIKAGTYSPTTWDSSGTSGSEIVIEAYGDGDVIVDCNISSRFRINGSYLIFDGGVNREFTFDGTGMTASYEKALYPQNNSNHVTLSRLKIFGTKKDSCNGSGSNVQGYGDYLHIYNCEIYEACDEGIYVTNGDYIEIRNNIIRDNDGQGIQFNPHETGYEVNNATVSGNLIFNNGYRNWSSDSIRSGIGILSNSNFVTDVDIYNNFIWGNSRRGIGVGQETNLRINIWNNTIYNNGQGGIKSKSAGTNTSKNNILFGNGTPEWKTGSGYLGPDATDLIADPSFLSTNQVDSDFLMLSAASTNAIDQGADLSVEGITEDFFGNLRSDGAHDVGAHEYGAVADTTPPNAPTGLTAQ